VINTAGIAVWVVALAYFWVWWLRPEHVYSPGRYAIVTIVLLWMTLIPVYYIVIFARARVPVSGPNPLEGSRVAIVVTKAPSEPFAVVSKTLEGALDQNGFAHDTWLADEDPAPSTLAWCEARRVRISSRKGVAEYHRETWPRRTRCKEGNLAYFYDHFGYDQYDFVAQFDADHVPAPDYLRHAIAPFADPRVGYVSAPSICDVNAAESWSARRRLYLSLAQSRMLHGQTRYSVRSRFIKEVPEGHLKWLSAKPAVDDWLGAGAFSGTSKATPMAARASGSVRSGVGGLEVGGVQFRVGQGVRHPRFGEGTILSLAGAGLDAQAQIHFLDVGTKTLALGIAKLDIIAS
jgi:hypothetical protein